MKKRLLSLLFIIGYLFTAAQDTKPTKEQTINYLTQATLNKQIYYLWRHTSTGSKWDEIYFDYKFIAVDFDGCICKIKYTQQRIQESNYGQTEKDDIKIKDVVIDFSKIESIIISASGYESANSTGETFCELVFTKQESNGTTYKITLPFISLGKVAWENYQSKEDKTIKAFNYLRKICGAPEPLNF